MGRNSYEAQQSGIDAQLARSESDQRDWRSLDIEDVDSPTMRQTLLTRAKAQRDREAARELRKRAKPGELGEVKSGLGTVDYKKLEKLGRVSYGN